MRSFLFFVFISIVGLVGIHGMWSGNYPPMRPAEDEMKPVYMSWQDLRNSIKSEPPQKILQRGKIGIRGKYLFINEPNKGIHIFNNEDPMSPKALAFVNIPGNLDLAIKGDVLFVDSFVDLVAIDIRSLPTIQVLNRQVDVFPYDAMQTADAENFHWYGNTDRNLGVVIGWKELGKEK